MTDRRRARVRALLARIARVAALLLPLALVLWWFLLREPRPPAEVARPRGPAERVEAPEERRAVRPERPEAAPRPAPAPGTRPAPAEPVPEEPTAPPGIAAFERRVTRALGAGQPPTAPLAEPAEPAPAGAPAAGIGAFERGVTGELEADQPRTAPLSEPEAAAEPTAPTGAIGVFERLITRRLARERPRTAPLTGPLRIRLFEVVWSGDEPAPFFRAEAVLAVLDAGALNRGELIAASLTLREPDVLLERRGPEAQWNFERVLGGLMDGAGPAAPANGPPLAGPTVVLNDVEIRGGRIEIRPPSSEPYRFLDIDAVLPQVTLAAPGRPPAVRVARLTTTADLPAAERPLALSVRAARVAVPDGRVRFAAERAALNGSVLVDVAGEWVPGAPGPGLAATLRAAPLQFADLRFLFPALPPEGTAAFALRIAPLPGGRTALRFSALTARTPDSRVSGALELAVGGVAGVALERADLRLDPLSLADVERFTGPTGYAGTLEGAVRGTPAELTFAVTARLTAPDVPEPFTAELAGSASFDAGGFALRGLDVTLRDVPLAALRPVAPGIPLQGRVTGRISLRGPPGQVPLELDVTLSVAGGLVALTGTLDLTGEAPAYDLTGRLTRVQLQALLEPAVPPVALTARFSFAGRGFDLPRMDARLRLDGRFTGWVTGPADDVRVQAELEAGTLALDTLSLVLAGLTVRAEGRWGLAVPGAGDLTYSLAVRDLEPFGPYLPLVPGTGLAGSVRTAGRLTGSAELPRVAGTLEGEALRYAGWSAGSLEAEYRLGLGGLLPEVEVRLVARDIDTPGAGTFDTATLRVDFAEPRFDVALEADRADGGIIALEAEGNIRADGQRDARIRRLVVDLADERWSLVRPARIAWGVEPGILVRDFVVREVEGEGLVAIEGRLPPTSTSGLRIEIEALPVGALLGLVTPEPVLTGELWVDARATGPEDDLRVGAEFRLVGGSLRDVPISRLEGALLYHDLRLDARIAAVVGAAGEVEVDAAIPVALRLTPAPQASLLEDLPMRVTLTADSASLTLVELLTPEVEDAEGLVRARAELTGTPANPFLDGSIQLWNGALTVPAFNQRYEEIMADIRLEDRRAVIRELRARSDGWAAASGTLTFAELSRPLADIRIRFEEFRALGVDDLDDAAVWGELHVSGDLSGPIITGDITVDDGYVELPSLDGGAAADQLVATGEPAPTGGGDVALGARDAAAEPDATSWFDRVVLDEVIVEAGDDLWFVTDEIRIQLHGELTLLKLEEDLRIFGTLEGERGTFTMRVGPLVRRFEIRSATVRFLGSPEPNPALDITASRLVLGSGGQPIEIAITVGGTLNSPTVALSTIDGASIPESELLSLLLFGQPSFALGEGAVPGTVLEEALFGVGSLAEVASIELEEALVADLGLPLDFIQIRPVPGAFAGLGVPTIAFGRQLGDDVFLTVDAGLGTLFGPSQAVTNAWSATLVWRIDPEWTLVLGIEPVDPGRLFRGIGTAFPVTAPDQQFIVELRRRWTY